MRSSQQTGANSDVQNVAGRFEAFGREGWVFGVWADANADNSANNLGDDYLVGVVGRATAAIGLCNFDQVIGVYGEGHSQEPPCNAPDWGGYFVGGLNTIGPTIFASDAMLKLDAQEGSDWLGIVSQLKPKVGMYNTSEFPMMGLEEGQHNYFIAQDVEQVLPDLVEEVIFPKREDADGNVLNEQFTYKGVNYIEFIPIAIGAIQQLSAQIATLEAQIAAADEAKMLEQNPGYEQNVKLANALVPILYQNTPNPHKGDCTIKYIVPEIISNCEVHFFDMYGNAIKVVPITQTGMGQLNIDAHDLAAGSYSYALVIDGAVTSSKVMIRE